MVSERTQVGIVGAGPAGLLLSRLLALAGIDSVVVENRSRAYCEARQRAGLLEDGTVRLLRAAGLADRLDRESLEHGGIYLQFAGERHHLDFRDLVGRTVTIYAQTEIVKDLISERTRAPWPRTTAVLTWGATPLEPPATPRRWCSPIAPPLTGPEARFAGRPGLRPAVRSPLGVLRRHTSRSPGLKARFGGSVRRDLRDAWDRGRGCAGRPGPPARRSRSA